jgi:hypothetical protein
MSAEIDPALLQRLLDCDPETGRLFWRERTPDMYEDEKPDPEYWCARWNARQVGVEAFTDITRRGNRVGRILDRACLRHCVIWAHQMGEWPVEEPEHVSGDRLDNRLANLQVGIPRREPVEMVSPAGYKGVLWDRARGRWLARIKDGRFVWTVGRFHDPDEAALARADELARYTARRT